MNSWRASGTFGFTTVNSLTSSIFDSNMTELISKLYHCILHQIFTQEVYSLFHRDFFLFTSREICMLTTLTLLKSSIFKLRMTERISKLCHLEYAQIKATRLKCIDANN